jgi:hypothetical protein
MQTRSLLVCLTVALLQSSAVRGDEPNETFATATVQAAGVLSVQDSLSAGEGDAPDTLIGAQGMFGDIYYVDDDGSPVGNGSASGYGGASTNSGSINFLVSGYPDDFFVGSHSEFGEYEVFVTAYDFFGDEVDSFSERRTLQPGAVDSFSYSDFNWLNGSYDVYIDNTVGGLTGGDIDFFTFTNLSPGANFAASTSDPLSTGIDTFMGWFDQNGGLIDADDDDAGGVLSLIEGIVPANGQLTFAVTGFGDTLFDGGHGAAGDYQLTIEVTTDSPKGDFNSDGQVNLADYTVWRDSLGATGTGLAADANADSVVDALDYAEWKDNFGRSSASTYSFEASNVPEPRSMVVACLLVAMVGISSRARKMGSSPSRDAL